MHAHQDDRGPADRGAARAAVRPAAPSAGRPPSLAALQRTAGNAATTRAIQAARHQHGPDCGHQEQPDHADQAVQRRAADVPAVQRRSSVFDAIGSPGEPLAPRIQHKAEQAYGMGFGHVRVHSGPVAQQSAKEYGALAYTTGSDIVVSRSSLDDETMFHEIDHVHQQAMGPVAGSADGSGVSVSDKGDRFERSSAENGRRMAQGGLPDLGMYGTAGGAAAGAGAGSVQRADAPPVTAEASGTAEASATAAAAPEAAPAGTRYQLQIQVSKAARSHQPGYLLGREFGHAWIAVYKQVGGAEKTVSTFGFYPQEGAFDRSAPLKTVPGYVNMAQDSPEYASSKFTADLDAEQYGRLKQYIKDNQNHDYNLATYNCTTFARGAYTAATGQSAPGLGLPVLENPNQLQDRIKRRNTKKGRPRKGEDIDAVRTAGFTSAEESDDDGAAGRGFYEGLVEMGTGAALPERQDDDRPRFTID
ncbi:DUF4157 domain-containing protein [Streptomyces sp. NPDC048277]|uniref:eCIS core domain-containing protein n=1 Tax=Streptomyces sp. NPDC048277 TaxID=3155027 RepID=UPI0033C2654C